MLAENRDYLFGFALVPAVFATLTGYDSRNMPNFFEIIVARPLVIEKPRHNRDELPVGRVYSPMLPRAGPHKLYGNSRRVTSS